MGVLNLPSYDTNFNADDYIRLNQIKRELPNHWKLPIFLPHEHVANVYPKVRLEAGTLHLAKYLIRTTVYNLMQKYSKFLICKIVRFHFL